MSEPSLDRGPPTVADTPTRTQPPPEGRPASNPLASTRLGSAAEPPRSASPLLVPGERVDDFEVLSLLGAGGFAQVFLARQQSLGRLVALKVSKHRGEEARTLARLEHDHIVHVFAEVVVPQRGLRLLCMQYVPGTTLARVIQALVARPRAAWSGRAFLDAVDGLCVQPEVFDPAALRDREFLAGCDFAEAVCWYGARLAEALAHAHAHGVLHRDVKPANVLINRYGRPLLADFNVSSVSRSDCEDEALGGTLAYMAPEHLDGFLAGGVYPTRPVDERSDVYSLGLVLFEMLTGREAFDPPPAEASCADQLMVLSAQRNAGAPSPRAVAEVPEALDRVVRRCLDPEPARRYATAAELARALDGCRELCRVARELPPAGPLTRAALRQPVAVAAFLILLPHVLGSIVNVSYNALRIVHDLTAAQHAVFGRLVAGYNLIVYGLGLVILYRVVAPLLRSLRRLSGPDPPGAVEVAAARRRALQLPLWVMGLSCLGWLPGGIVFPLGLDLLAGPVSAGVYGHFLVSFTLSGLVALTYAVFAMQFIVLRVLYPRLWADAQDLRAEAGQELRTQRRRLAVLQALAVLIPLAGAAMMVGVGPEQFTPVVYRRFRLLVTALLGLGMAGLGLTMMVSGILHQTLAALMGHGGTK